MLRPSGGLLRIITASAVMMVMLAPRPAGADLVSEIAKLREREQELQRQIEQYQKEAAAAGAQSRTLQHEIAKLNAQISQLNAEISSLEASIDRTGLEIGQTQEGIVEAERAIGVHQEALGSVLRETDAIDRQSLTEVLLKHQQLSDFFDYINSVERAQDTLRLTIRSIKELREELDGRREELESKRSELEQMQALQELQQRQIALTKNSKDRVLRDTKGQEAKFQSLVVQGQKDLQRLREQIYYLVQSGISVEDAVKYAQLAAIGAGIRPAFLLALLEVESRLGRNVGTGNWRDDMYLCYQRLAEFYPTKRAHYLQRAETEKAAYFKIVTGLGLDPDSQKVSREPTYGCGGAMGPAQFIPSTWLAYSADVTRITGHNPPNPWNFQDAFSASALKLSKGGATSQDAAGETRAAKAYISGNPSCTSATCNSYANTILKKAADIERDL
jgi:peptidoglycan hydrolase CwlO-like protein